jgi:predicted DNA-binding transcriptional regulator YafY
MPQSIGTAFAPRQAFTAEHILAIMRARRLGMGLSVNYAPLNKPAKTYRVFPVLLWFSDGEPYCWVWDTEADWLKNFKICRARSMNVIELPGMAPTGIEGEAKRLCSQSFRGIASDDQRARVVVRFSDGAIPFIKGRTFGDNQKTEDLPSGEVRLSFSTLGLGGVYHWILQFGADAVVEKPRKLADWVRDEAERILDRAT